MKAVYKAAFVTAVVFVFFCLMSKFDFIVHEKLYNYGLFFSYEWALDYWITYWSAFIVFSVIITVMYWLGSGKTMGDLMFSLTVCLTINLLMIGGVQDLLFFLLWGDGLPGYEVVWWWSPWIYVFGTWNSSMQLVLSSLIVSVNVFIWSVLIVFTTKQEYKRVTGPALEIGRDLVCACALKKSEEPISQRRAKR